jgi:hypothetical protein
MIRAEVSMSTDPSWIGQHQAIVAAFIVFVGVIVGLVGNGLLQRWDRNSKRNHDREATRMALVAELGHLVHSYEHRVELMKQTTGHFSVPVHVPTEVYDAMLDKVGLLRLGQSTAVIHAYLAAKHLPMNLRRIEDELLNLRRIDDHLPPEIGEPRGDYVRVSPSNMETAIRMHETRIELYKAAIAVLKGEWRPPKSDDDKSDAATSSNSQPSVKIS